MIQEEERKTIFELIRKYKMETGKEATSGGEVTKEFKKWRKLKFKSNDE